MRLAVVILAVVLAGCAPSTGWGGDPAATPHPPSGPTAEYFSWLHKYDISTDDPQNMLVAGNAICSDLRQGKSAEAEIKLVYRLVPDVSEKKAGLLVSAAQMGLCPETG